MLFNSLEFAVFFPLVIILYFLVPHKFRWIFLLLASYYFYMCWKAEYAILILFSTVVDYFVALKMGSINEKPKRKKWLYISLAVNLGLLFAFKYFNFVGDSINAVLNQFNMMAEIPVFNLLLPVGISFYTFQTLSYSIDVYNGKIKPEKHFGIFALYVSFFPQLVAGPIERPDRLLPQFREKFTFEYDRVVNGLRMMAWGFFMKLVIADNVAPIVDTVFKNPHNFEGFQVILATVFFAFQIFCDFAGYSIIAIGTAKIMGYNLMQNFNRPYFATSIREFWQRWHISLSTWFRDYLYIPLGGNRVVKWRWYYNLMVTFVVSGLWHGANWTFVAWGFLHGFYLVFAIVSEAKRQKISESIGLSKMPRLLNFSQVASTFILACLAWVFFRAQSVSDALTLLGNMTKLSFSQLSWNIIPEKGSDIILALFFITVLQFIHFSQEYLKWENPLFSKSTTIRWTAYFLIGMSILSFGRFASSEFIYFRF